MEPGAGVAAGVGDVMVGAEEFRFGDWVAEQLAAVVVAAVESCHCCFH